MNAAKILPRELTSYDVLKFFAVVIMVIDHMGYYFYPDIDMFRAVGRIGFPVWFFLIGYASGRGIDWTLIVGSLLLTASAFAVGLFVFPLTALVTIILIRLMLDPLMRVMLTNAGTFVAGLLIMLLLIIPSGDFVEYGTQGLILAVFGYVARRRPAIPGFGNTQESALFMMLFSAASFTLIQQMAFKFALPELLFMASGTLLVCAALYAFRPMVLPGLPALLRAPVQFCGRHTLAIYVGHLLLFRMAALLWIGAPYEFMTLRLFTP